jgi:hypothetical protein
MKNIRSIIFNFCSISTPVAVQYVNGTLAGPTRYIEVYKGFHWGHRNNVPVNQGIRTGISSYPSCKHVCWEDTLPTALDRPFSGDHCPDDTSPSFCPAFHPAYSFPSTATRKGSFNFRKWVRWSTALQKDNVVLLTSARFNFNSYFPHTTLDKQSNCTLYITIVLQGVKYLLCYSTSLRKDNYIYHIQLTFVSLNFPVQSIFEAWFLLSLHNNDALLHEFAGTMRSFKLNCSSA